MKTRMNKVGQEEIIGFVLIMLVVAVILVVFLGISLRQDLGSGSVRESDEIYQFLESSGQYTSDCQIRSSEYASLEDLFEKCLSEEKCINDLDSCDILEESMRGIIEASWNYGEEGAIKGYRFGSYYVSEIGADIESGEEILVFEDGSCEGSLRGSDYLIPAFPGRVVERFEICF